MPFDHYRTLLVGLLSIGATAIMSHAAHAQVNYYALGDSYAFGYQTPGGVTPGNGEASLFGYVGTNAAPGSGSNATVSQYLATTLGKNAAVTNLGIPGETTYSYLGTTAPPYVPAHSIGDNTNYTSSTPSTQRGFFDSLPSNSASDITLQLGGNDIVDYLYANVATGGFNGQTTTQIDAQIAAVENVTLSNLGTIVGDIKARDSAAQVFLIGYADLFQGIKSNTAATTLNGYDVYALQNYDSLLKNLATSTGTTFVDPSPAFTGHEAAYSYIDDASQNVSSPPITLPDYHPNATGYGVIARQIEANAGTPEPTTLALLAVPLALAAWGGIRRRIQ